MKYLLAFTLVMNLTLCLVVIALSQMNWQLEGEIANLTQLVGHNFLTMDMDASCMAQLNQASEIRLQIIQEEK